MLEFTKLFGEPQPDAGPEPMFCFYWNGCVVRTEQLIVREHVGWSLKLLTVINAKVVDDIWVQLQAELLSEDMYPFEILLPWEEDVVVQ